MIDGLDEPHTACLKDVVGIGILRPESFDQGEDEPHIADDEFLTRRPISPFERLHQAVVLLRRKFREPGCIHSADDDLLQHTHLLCTPLLYLSSLPSFLFIQNAQ